MAKLIKKISAKNVCGKMKQEVLTQGPDGKDIIGFKEKDIMQVIGVATATRSGETTFGDFMGLRGQFQATNLETGETFRSSQCFLADDLTDLIAAQLSTEGVKTVEFAFMVGIRPNETAIGYEYTARPLMETSNNDPLEKIMAQIGGDNAKPEKLETDAVDKAKATREAKQAKPVKKVPA